MIEARNRAIRSHAGEKNASGNPYAMTRGQALAIVVSIAFGTADIVLAFVYGAGLHFDGFCCFYGAAFVVCLVALAAFEVLDRMRRRKLGGKIMQDRRSELTKIRWELVCRGVSGKECLASLREEVDRFIQAREGFVEEAADRAWSLLVTTVLAAVLGSMFGVMKDGEFFIRALVLAAMIVMVFCLVWVGVRGLAHLFNEGRSPRLSEAREFRDDLTALLLCLDGQPGFDSDPCSGQKCDLRSSCFDDGR